ncbi:MAG: 23S rRNA (uracil(1939)-C(5))-methyltransferase RlmD [Endomicrobia bacterium]|nr:23S rRNA (uracil(1939)-C(5))-methyltransferase RlmD [Endomicrobiia bacterium]
MSLKNKTISVTAEKIVFPGRSLCRCEDGIALFTEGLLPGEAADVLVIKDKKSFREGVLAKITQKSPERIEPVCHSFGRCGGCTFQNTDYENQIKYKKIYFDELLGSLGAETGAILKSPAVWNYRNKMELSFFNEGDNVSLGLHCRGSFDRYVSVPPCFIADKDFLKAAEAVKNFANKNKLPAYDKMTHEGFFRHLVLRKAQNNGEFLINIVTNRSDLGAGLFEPIVKELKEYAHSIYWTHNGRLSDAVVVDKFELLYGKEHITEKLNVGGKDYFFNISPFSFFQTNSKGAEILYNEVLRLLKPSKSDTLLDLYCGTGTIGISLADKVKKVIAIEQVAQAIDDANENAKQNNVNNAEFFALTAEKWAKENNEKFDAVVVDPPRSGLTNDVIKFLTNSGAKKIVYVSCNPSTLARDLGLIKESGKYAVRAITPVDMFPQTYHIEAAVLLERQ